MTLTLVITSGLQLVFRTVHDMTFTDAKLDMFGKVERMFCKLDKLVMILSSTIYLKMEL